MINIKRPFLSAIFFFIVIFFSATSAQTLKVEIKGLKKHKEARTNVINALSIYAFHQKPAPQPLRLEWLQERAIDEIKTALEPYGFYNVEIEDKLTMSGDIWVSTFNITLNEPIRIEAISFGISGEGMRKRIFKRILQQSKLKLDQPLMHEYYEETKDRLMDAALERGYFDTQFTDHAIWVNLDQYQSQVALLMDTGQRYYFDSVTYDSNYFHPEFLKRYVQINPSVQYAEQTILDLQADMNASDYFEEITITPTINYEQKKVPVNIRVTPRKRRIFNAAIGYGTDIGFRFSGTANWRYLNSWGHKMTNEMLLAQKQQRLLVKYTIPGKYPARSHFDFYIQYDHEDTKYKNYTTALIGLSSTRTKNNFTQTYALDFRKDRFKDSSGTRQNATLIIPSAFFEWKSRENIRFGRQGFKISANIRGASETLASDLNFFQLHVKGHYFLPIGRNDRVIFRGELGHTFIKKEDISKLPPSLRFHAGGDYSVRGYRLDSIGETGYQKEVVGGKKLVISSLEWEHRFSKEWSGAAFIDAGDAYNSTRPKWKVGAGIGVRWFSPVGSVRFDIAHGFHRQGDSLRLHLNIGADL